MRVSLPCKRCSRSREDEKTSAWKERERVSAITLQLQSDSSITLCSSLSLSLFSLGALSPCLSEMWIQTRTMLKQTTHALQVSLSFCPFSRSWCPSSASDFFYLLIYDSSPVRQQETQPERQESALARAPRRPLSLTHTFHSWFLRLCLRLFSNLLAYLPACTCSPVTGCARCKKQLHRQSARGAPTVKNEAARE